MKKWNEFLSLFRPPEPVPEYDNEVEQTIASIAQSLYRELLSFAIEYDSTDDLSQHFTDIELECLEKRINITDVCRGGNASFADIGNDLHIRTDAAERHYNTAFNKLPDDLKRKYQRLEDMI